MTEATLDLIYGERRLTAKAEVYDIDSRKVFEQELEVVVPGESCVEAFTLPFASLALPQPHFIVLRLLENGMESYRLIPGCVVFRNEHPSVADGEDVYLVRYGFIDNAVRSAEYLAEPVNVFRGEVEALWRDGGTHIGEEFKLVRFFLNANIPFGGILRRSLISDDMEDVGEKLSGMWRPLWLHVTDPSLIQPLIMASISLNTSSLGIPLPSANSRREISTSRERSSWSKRSSMNLASTRYEAARPFCVMRTGRCVSRTRPMYMERLLRHSENGTTSSEGRQRRSGISRTVGIAFSPFLLFLKSPRIVQNFALAVNGAGTGNAILQSTCDVQKQMQDFLAFSP